MIRVVYYKYYTTVVARYLIRVVYYKYYTIVVDRYLIRIVYYKYYTTVVQYGSQKSSRFLLIEKRYFTVHEHAMSENGTNTQCVKNGTVRLNGKLNGVN